ncbi:MAG: helix-turn-helix transcriptional regulator [Candidatus Tectomicrobia bacterium]
MLREEYQSMTRDEQALAHEIGLILQRLRHEHGLTQKSLAQRVVGGLNTTYIGKIERGDQLPSLKILLRLSTALDVSVNDFFYPPALKSAEEGAPALHLEPLLQALRNRGIDGIGLVRAILDAVGQHVLVAPPRRVSDDELPQAGRIDGRMVIPLPQGQSEQD